MTTAFTDDTTVVAATTPVSTRVDGAEVILHPDTGQYHGLNGIGPDIWERIQEPTTVTALVESVADEYGVRRDRVRSDVESFLQELHTAELIRVDAQTA